jgi:hypothetical protein
MLRRLSLYGTKFKAFSTLLSSTNLCLEMKKLIDSKQYRKALDLFQKQSESRTDISINMAIEACTKLHDYQQGINIQQQLTPSSLNNSFIQRSLLDFHSKLFIFFINQSLNRK